MRSRVLIAAILVVLGVAGFVLTSVPIVIAMGPTGVWLLVGLAISVATLVYAIVIYDVRSTR